LEISEIWKFQTFRKLRKNDVQLELWKLRNIRSDSETDPKVQLKVWNAGPYQIRPGGTDIDINISYRRERASARETKINSGNKVAYNLT